VRLKRGRFVLVGIIALLSLTLGSAVDFTIGDEVGDVDNPSLDIDFVDFTYDADANAVDVVFHLVGENGQIANPPNGTYNFVVGIPGATNFKRVFLSYTGHLNCYPFCSNPVKQGNTISFTYTGGVDIGEPLSFTTHWISGSSLKYMRKADSTGWKVPKQEVELSPPSSSFFDRLKGLVG
jgi:hypothetical protein